MLYLIFIAIALLSVDLLSLFLLRNTSTPRSTAFKGSVWIATAVMLAGGGLYALLGQPDMPEKLARHEARMRDLAFHIEQLSIRTQHDPGNPVYWAALGEAFMRAEQYAPAVRAYRQAVLNSGGDPMMIMNMAKAQLMTTEGKMNPDAKKALEMVLSMQPDNAEAKQLLERNKQLH